MRSIVQSLSAEAVQISLKGCKIPGKVCDEFNIFCRSLRFVRFFLGEVEDPRENSWLFKRLFGKGKGKISTIEDHLRVIMRTLRV